jgi:hypothetical protein
LRCLANNREPREVWSSIVKDFRKRS